MGSRAVDRRGGDGPVRIAVPYRFDRTTSAKAARARDVFFATIGAPCACAKPLALNPAITSPTAIVKHSARRSGAESTTMHKRILFGTIAAVAAAAVAFDATGKNWDYPFFTTLSASIGARHITSRFFSALASRPVRLPRAQRQGHKCNVKVKQLAMTGLTIVGAIVVGMWLWNNWGPGSAG